MWSLRSSSFRRGSTGGSSTWMAISSITRRRTHCLTTPSWRSTSTTSCWCLSMSRRERWLRHIMLSSGIPRVSNGTFCRRSVTSWPTCTRHRLTTATHYNFNKIQFLWCPYSQRPWTVSRRLTFSTYSERGGDILQILVRQIFERNSLRKCFLSGLHYNSLGSSACSLIFLK